MMLAAVLPTSMKAATMAIVIMVRTTAYSAVVWPDSTPFELLLLHDASNRRPADGDEDPKATEPRTGAFS